MRSLIRILIVFALAVGLAVGMRFNTGNVVIFYAPTQHRIDINLNFFLVLIFVLFWMLYYLVRTYVFTMEMPKKVMTYRAKKKDQDGIQALREALKSLFEGRFGRAEKYAMKAADVEGNEELASLIGARAAHFMTQYERRDAWFARIENHPQYRSARLVTMAELYVDAHKSDEALETINQLTAKGERHIQVLRWALKANQQAKNWNEVLRLVRVLEKNHAIHAVLANRLREMAYESLIHDNRYDAEGLRRMWSSVPSSDKRNKSVAYVAAHAFVRNHCFDEARGIIEKSVVDDWDVRLIRLYREAMAPENSAALRTQIEYGEAWLAQQPRNPEIALTLGVLCYQQKLWGQAQKYMEQALSHSVEGRTLRETNLNLARLYETLEQTEQAAKYYKQCAMATKL